LKSKVIVGMGVCHASANWHPEDVSRMTHKLSCKFFTIAEVDKSVTYGKKLVGNFLSDIPNILIIIKKFQKRCIKRITAQQFNIVLY
jgi:hypothetical protein